MTPLRELYEEFVREKTKKRFAKRIGLPAPPSQIPCGLEGGRLQLRSGQNAGMSGQLSV